MAILTDEEIKNKTKQFQQEVQEIEDVKQNDYLDKILPSSICFSKRRVKTCL